VYTIKECQHEVKLGRASDDLETLLSSHAASPYKIKNAFSFDEVRTDLLTLAGDLLIQAGIYYI